MQCHLRLQVPRMQHVPTRLLRPNRVRDPSGYRMQPMQRGPVLLERDQHSPVRFWILLWRYGLERSDTLPGRVLHFKWFSHVQVLERLLVSTGKHQRSRLSGGVFLPEHHSNHTMCGWELLPSKIHETGPLPRRPLLSVQRGAIRRVLVLHMHRWYVLPSRVDELPVVHRRILLPEYNHNTTMHPRRLLPSQINRQSPMFRRLSLSYAKHLHRVRLRLLLCPSLNRADNMRSGVLLHYSRDTDSLQYHNVLCPRNHRTAAMPARKVLCEPTHDCRLHQWQFLSEWLHSADSVCSGIGLCDPIFASTVCERDVLSARFHSRYRPMRARLPMRNSSGSDPMQPHVLLRPGNDGCAAMHGGVCVPESIDQDRVCEQDALFDRVYSIRAMPRWQILHIWHSNQLLPRIFLPCELL